MYDGGNIRIGIGILMRYPLSCSNVHVNVPSIFFKAGAFVRCNVKWSSAFVNIPLFVRPGRFLAQDPLF